jgi:hypothetical protein
MKNLKGFGIIVFSALMILVSCTGEQKVEIANKEFCHSLKTFSKALDNLDIANEGTDVNAFDKAYEKAAKDWDKLVSSAEHLEDVQINESVKAYNKMVDKINKISADGKTVDDADQINQEIDATSDKIAKLMTTECK